MPILGALPTGFNAPRVVGLFLTRWSNCTVFLEILLSISDTIFLCDFWMKIMTLSRKKLQFTSVYHPQTDGQSEVTNQTLEQYLREFTCEQHHKCSDFLPWVELDMNFSTDVNIGMSPFQALYG